MAPGPDRMRVLIAGGGVAGLEALLALRELAEERVEIELLAPQRDFVYRPLAVAEPFGRGRAYRFDLAALVEEQGALFRPDALASVDPDRATARTRAGRRIAYDALVLACGAVSRQALPGALTFWGSPTADASHQFLGELQRGAPREIVFALPPDTGWPLPAYELALLTRIHLASIRADEVGVTIATHEPRPLDLFGDEASDAIATLLRERGIGLCTGCRAFGVEAGALALEPAGRLVADRVVTLPRLEGRAIPGIPCDEQGFVAVDRHGLVEGLDDVYAAGDATSYPVKQGGLAAQQADAVAEELAQRAGALVDPQPFRPVLRGLLLTGGRPAFMRAELNGGSSPSPRRFELDSQPLWWPPGKIAGRYLAPHLAAKANALLDPPPPPEIGSVEVDLELPQGTPKLL